MNLGTWPDGVPFDPAGGVDSLELKAILSGPGADWATAVLAAGEGARSSGWAARAAISIAESWAAAGRRVVLADLCLDEPELHDHLGEPNNEGLADVFMFGASPASVTHRRHDRTFDLIPAGAFVPDSAEVYRSDEWPKLLRSLRSDRTLLLAYAPIGAAGFEALADRLGNLIVLAADPDAAKGQLDLAASLVKLVLRPAAPVPVLDAAAADEDEDEPGVARRPAREEEDEAPVTGVTLEDAPSPHDEEVVVAAGEEKEDARATGEPDVVAEPRGAPIAARPPRLDDEEFERIRLPKDAAREALIADLRQRQRSAMMVPPPDAAGEPERSRRRHEETVTGERAAVPAGAAPRPAYPARPPELEVPPTDPDFVASERPKRRAGRHRRIVLATLLAVLLIGLVGGLWHWRGSWLEQWRTPPSGVPASAAEPAAAPSETAPPVAAATRLPYSVAIEAHQNFDIALDRLAALNEEAPRFAFYVSPVLVNNTVYYRVMSGPVADSAGAAGLMAELLTAGHKTGSSPADIRQTPLAFHLGTAPTRADALRRVQELHALAIPAYIILTDTPAGLVYRVYGGGYASPADAEVMRELLRSAGQPDSLIERTGRSPR